MSSTRSFAFLAAIAAIMVASPAFAAGADKPAQPAAPAKPDPNAAKPPADPKAPDATKPDATKPDTTKPDATKPDATPPAGGGDSGAGTAPDANGAPTPPAGPEAPNVRLRKLEQRVQALKEQAWRLKARIGMLKEAVLGGGIGARATIIHENKMGGSFRLIKIVYALDGTQVFAEADTADTGKLNDKKHFDILSGPIAPGNHTLSVLLVYRGHGYGVFEYLKQYKFTVRSSYTITVSEGKQTQVTVVGFEKGGVTTPLEKRPAVDFKVNYVSDIPAGKGK